MTKIRNHSLLSIRNLSALHQGPYSLEVNSGECVVIIGESGVGKSLFLRMIADLIPNEGKVYLDNKDRNLFIPSQWRKQITYVSAESGWWAKTVKEHFNDLELAHYWFPKLNLKETLLDADVTQLSTGEKQRMALIRALSSQVQFLLLDEITSALDPKSVITVEQCVRELLEQNLGIVLISHNMDQVRRLATRHYELTSNSLEFCK